MAVRIRLKRIGCRHRSAYRVAAMDIRRARDGRVLEELGYYDPCNANPDLRIKLNQERIAHWLGVGATPSDTVRNLLKKTGTAAGAKG
ncbi:MAG: 30S ribosomal protein S16 [Phycisphaerales bacterium]|nr:30S ribosomal protein S16 [Phycisphaerales bacterium]